MKLLPSRRVLCTPYNHAPCHFMQSHIRKVYACLAVTCHLHFWQNGRDLLRATAVTRGWNGYGNKSQHRKLTLENKILPLVLQGFKPVTFQSGVRHSNHWAILLPVQVSCWAVHMWMWENCKANSLTQNNSAVVQISLPVPPPPPFRVQTTPAASALLNSLVQFFGASQ